MTSPASGTPLTPSDADQTRQADEWARRRAGNLRLGLIFGGITVVLFLISIWKYRPL